MLKTERSTYFFPKNGNREFAWKTVDYKKTITLSSVWENEWYHLIYVNKGNGSCKVDFKEMCVSPTQLFFVRPGQVVTLKVSTHCKGICIGFSEVFCQEQVHTQAGCKGILFQPPDHLPMIQIPSKQLGEFNGFLEAMRKELTVSAVGQKEMLATYLRLLLISASRIKSTSIRSEVLSDADFELKTRFTELVEEHYKSLHSVSDYAKMLGISSKSISKRFHQLHAGKPSDIIKNRIVLEAKRLLSFSDLSVKEIGFELGFNDPGYFSRFFKKAVTISPIHYRQN
jgi:AraC family transcriptional activator of pobA